MRHEVEGVLVGRLAVYGSGVVCVTKVVPEALHVVLGVS